MADCTLPSSSNGDTHININTHDDDYISTNTMKMFVVRSCWNMVFIFAVMHICIYAYYCVCIYASCVCVCARGHASHHGVLERPGLHFAEAAGSRRFRGKRFVFGYVAHVFPASVAGFPLLYVLFALYVPTSLSLSPSLPPQSV